MVRRISSRGSLSTGVLVQLFWVASYHCNPSKKTGILEIISVFISPFSDAKMASTGEFNLQLGPFWSNPC